MIELDVGPRHSRMTVGALRAHGVAVHVVRFMAGKAVRRSFPVLAVCFMAFDAFGFPVLSEKGKIRKAVIEGVFVELDDIGVAAFMVGMTGCAAGVVHLG